jgi:ATP-binding cassette, subfamily C, bacterial LapB
MSQNAAEPIDARALQQQLSERLGAEALLTAAPHRLAETLCGGTGADLGSHGPFAACLVPWLSALGWRGHPRDLAEALPYFAKSLSLTDLLNVLATLGFVCRSTKVRRGAVDPRLMPALLVTRGGEPLVVLGETETGWRIWDGAGQLEREVAPRDLDGVLHTVVRRVDDRTKDEQPYARSWTARLFGRFAPSFRQLLAISLFTNCIAISASFFMMAVYDKVIPTRNGGTLLFLALGMGVFVLADAVLHQVRARIVAHVGARVETLVATATFRQLIELPTAAIDGAPVSGQMSRLREFDSIRDLFTGPMASVALELPFILLFVGVIWFIAGPVVWVPVVMIALYGLAGLLIEPALRRALRRSSVARAKRHSFLIDMLNNMATVKQLSVEALWKKRFDELSGNLAYSHFRVTQLSQQLQTVTQAITMAAGASVIAWSALRVIDGDLSLGGMIATMTLVWRLISPIHSLFLALLRLEQAKLSAKQLNHLMRLPTETRRRTGRIQRNIVGEVRFDRVSFRYSAAADPALLGVSFKVPPGSFVAITGGNSSGKSTLLSLILALHRPQAGGIFIDGVDIRQSDAVAMRRAIGYVPQNAELFHGSILQNLRLGNPIATLEEVEQACATIGILDAIRALPEGFDTHVDDHSRERFSAGLRQGLAIARALVKQSRLLLLDESAQLLDAEASQAFERMLLRLKGKTTIMLVTHRPSHMALADQILVLEQGQVTGLGTPETIMPEYMARRMQQGAAA